MMARAATFSLGAQTGKPLITAPERIEMMGLVFTHVLKYVGALTEELQTMIHELTRTTELANTKSLDALIGMLQITI